VRATLTNHRTTLDVGRTAARGASAAAPMRVVSAWPRLLSRAAALLGLGLCAVLGSCSGNISCVFTTGCQGGGGGIAGAAATLPEDGLWIADPRPTVEASFPDGTQQNSTTPIVIRFSESMSADSLTGAIEIIPIINGLETSPLPGVPQALVGDGRLLVLLPTVLTAGDYVVRLAQDANATDLTGQELDLRGGAELTSFQVDSSDPVEPSLVMSWPPDGTGGASDSTTIVVVFDRAVDASSVDDAAFDVKVNGVDPAQDPLPLPLSITVAGFPIQDTRVYTYRSADSAGVPQFLGTSAAVVVTLSTSGSEILDLAGEALPETIFDFTTVDVATPISGAILSQPSDAIGISNLTAGNAEELAIQVDLLDGLAGDSLDVFLFGTNPDPEDPKLIALLRTQELNGAGTIVSSTLDLDALDLLLGGPTEARFADGRLAFAFRVRRGNTRTPLRVLDVDTTASGIQDPTIDTTAPVVLELLVPGGATDLASSDQRGVPLSGRASELVRAAEVTSDAGTNGTLPEVVGSRADGLFLAKPVDAFVLPSGSATYTLTVYDQALNASAPVSGSFTQLGAVGPGSFIPGDPLTVQVFDASTLLPLAGALVITHGDMGDGLTYPFVASAATDAGGLASVASAAAPNVGTLVTVDLPGHDLWTFHGITAGRISVPLEREGSGDSARVSGVLTSSSDLADLTLSLLPRIFDEARRSSFATGFYEGETCTSGPFGGGELSCPYGPEPVRPGRLGAQSFLSGTFSLSEATFSAPTLLQAFDLQTPLPILGDGQADETAVDVAFLLAEPAAPDDELPTELPLLAIVATLTDGIDFGNLDDEPLTTGEPRVGVEALVPGLPGAVTVGLGLAFDQGSNVWNVRSAQPGAVTPGGFYGLRGTVDTDLLLRAELRDVDGNLSGQRPRVSQIPGLPVPNVVVPPDVPSLVSPPDGGSSGATSFDVVFGNTLIDAYAEPGLVQVELTDAQGRGWDLWRVDPPDAAGDVRVHVPDLAPAGGVGLASGTITCRLSSFGWPTLDVAEFLWSDVEREHDVYARSEPFSFSLP
jgi:hypothetical protein